MKQLTGERKQVLIAFAYFFFVIFTYYLVKPLREGLFLEHFSSKAIPVVNLLTLIGISFFGWLYNGLHRSLSRKNFLLAINAVQLTIMAAFGLGLHSGGDHGQSTLYYRGLVACFYIWINIFNLFPVALFWSIANEHFDTKTAKRHYGLIGSGGIAGGVSAGVAAEYLFRFIPPKEMVLISLPFAALCAIFPLLLLGTKHDPAAKQPAAIPAASLLSEIMLVVREPYLFFISLIVFVRVLTGTIFHYEFYAALQKHMAEGLYTQVNNLVQLSINLVALAISLLITPFCLKHFAVGKNLSALPGTMLVVSCFLLFDLWMPLLGGGILLSAITYSLDKSSKELLYIPTEVAVKYRVKSFIDTFVYRLGSGSGSLLMLGVQLVPSVSLVSFCCKLVLAAIWLYAVIRATGIYKNLLEQREKAQTSGGPSA